MSQFTEIQDPEVARRFVWQGLGMARTAGMTTSLAAEVLRVVDEMAGQGWPVPLLGFVYDVVRTLYPKHAAQPHASDLAQFIAGAPLDSALARRYDDYVIGKLAADMTIERAADELHKYAQRDLDRALAFAMAQVAGRTGLNGVMLSPSIIKALLKLPPEQMQKEFYEAHVGGYSPQLVQSFDDLIQQVRNTGELLGPEDIFELSSGTALSPYSQRIALRQTLQAVAQLTSNLPKAKPKTTSRQYSVATKIQDEDFYPVGGFSSISNRGTIESLLRSELAYMDLDQRPDIFDIKFARDELLYYSRDENQFFRRRLSYLFIFQPDLIRARVKDPSMQWQRIIYVLATVIGAVRTLTDWLSSDALTFHLLFPLVSSGNELQSEFDLLQTIFKEDIRSGLVRMQSLSQAQLNSLIETSAKQSLCFCTWLHAEENAQAIELPPSLLSRIPPPLSLSCDELVANLEDSVLRLVHMGGTGRASA